MPVEPGSHLEFYLLGNTDQGLQGDEETRNFFATFLLIQQLAMKLGLELPELEMGEGAGVDAGVREGESQTGE